jgi:hypothetical protein
MASDIVAANASPAILIAVIAVPRKHFFCRFTVSDWRAAVNRPVAGTAKSRILSAREADAQPGGRLAATLPGSDRGHAQFGLGSGRGSG